MKSLAKNKLTYGLVIIVIAIWGLILYELIMSFEFPDSKIDVTIKKSELVNFNDIDDINEPIDIDTVQYIKFNRDPFSLVRTKKLYKERKKIVVKKPEEIFQFRIEGILINNTSRMVILEDLGTKETLFLREGDSYKNVIVRKVNKGNVVLVNGGETKSFSISN